MLTARKKTIERTGTGRQFPPSLASLSATKFSLQIYMELTAAGLQEHQFMYLITLFADHANSVAGRQVFGNYKN